MTIHKSMLEAAIEILKRKRSPQPFDKIFKEVVAELSLTEEEGQARVARFYNDLSLSGVFIYTGDNEWDLKERQSVDMWDKDASFFIDPDELKARKAQRAAEKAALKQAIEEAQKLAEKSQQEKAEKAAQKLIDAEEKLQAEKEEVVTEEKTTPAEKPESGEDEEKYIEYMDEYEDLYEDKK